MTKIKNNINRVILTNEKVYLDFERYNIWDIDSDFIIFIWVGGDFAIINKASIVSITHITS
jgi:hypothetical protein